MSQNLSDASKRILASFEAAKLVRVNRTDVERFTAQKQFEVQRAQRNNAFLLATTTADRLSQTRLRDQTSLFKRLEQESNARLAAFGSRSSGTQKWSQSLLDGLHKSEENNLAFLGAQQKEFEKFRDQKLKSINAEIAKLSREIKQFQKRKATANAAERKAINVKIRNLRMERGRIEAELAKARAVVQQEKGRFAEKQTRDWLTGTIEAPLEMLTSPEVFGAQIMADAFLSIATPSPEDIAQQARNQVEAGKILLTSKDIGIDTEALNVEKVQKEIAGE